MSNLQISVVLTTHDGRKAKCKRAIESVLAQTFSDFELIVVDDASQDGTREMVREFSDKRIRYIRRKTCKHNQAYPKNDGIKASEGRFIAFLDSDNKFKPEHLSILYKAITADESLDVVYGDRMIIDEINKKKAVGVFSDFHPGLLMERNYIDTSDSLIKRSALIYLGGWDTDYKRFLDWNLYIRLAKAGYKFKRIPKVITDYYIHKSMLSFEVENRENPNQPLWDPVECPIRLLNFGPIDEPTVAIFSLTYDRLAYTKEAFKTLYETAGYPFQHVVVDNGSSDGTAKWLDEELVASNYCIGLHTISNGENMGISIASNQAVNHIENNLGCDIIVKVDNDAFFRTEGWLKRMIDIWKKNHMLAMSPYIEGLRDNPGGAERIGYGQIDGELVGVTRHLGGICHFADASAYDNFRWPEDETLHGFQDMEMSQHLLNNGYQMCYLENFFVSHGPAGTQAQEDEQKEYFERRKIEKQTKYEGNS